MKYRKSHSETYTNAVNAPTEYTTSEKLLTIRLYLSLFKVSSDSSYPWTPYNDNLILEDVKESLISFKQ